MQSINNFQSIISISTLGLQQADTPVINCIFLVCSALEFVNLFIVQDKEKQVIIAANVVGSYFQDKFPTCHHLAVTGKPGSGKTSIGHTFVPIGYRPIYQLDPSASISSEH